MFKRNAFSEQILKSELSNQIFEGATLWVRLLAGTPIRRFHEEIERKADFIPRLTTFLLLGGSGQNAHFLGLARKFNRRALEGNMPSGRNDNRQNISSTHFGNQMHGHGPNPSSLSRGSLASSVERHEAKLL
ncbi:hypothetical protein [Agrobacterium vitis]|uniref:Uncharacterized protein n=1 Tax=Agrobacterium vitis TaxID=373 RepID=A0A7K1RBT4_AGRVI|nr:hypothetical protein [Agrobacterium vitis]MVA55543.1 hypothetical protein [Agrobacterium vitis]